MMRSASLMNPFRKGVINVLYASPMASHLTTRTQRFIAT